MSKDSNVDNTTPAIEPLDIWTVYHNPSDYPGKYVARKFTVTKDVTATRDMFVADTIEEIRALLPQGLYHLTRQPDDDPVIIETWF
jgi:hypothetical protein